MRQPESVIWNLFLAFIPVVVGFLIAYVVGDARKRRARINWAIAAPLLFLWLIFLPNACYLVTEWRHFIDVVASNPNVFYAAKHGQQALFQFLLISTFYVLYSSSGMVAFFLAIWPVDRAFHVPWWGKGVLFVLCALGVYLGLINRFNSWQVARHFGPIMVSAIYAVSRPAIDILIVAFAAVLWFAYFLFEIFMDGLLLRRQKLLAK